MLTIAALAAVGVAVLAASALVASLAVVVVLAGLITIEHLKNGDPSGSGAATDAT